jgi:hypothetical protein
MFAAAGSASYSKAVHYDYTYDFAVTYINVIIKDPISGICILCGETIDNSLDFCSEVKNWKTFRIWQGYGNCIIVLMDEVGDPIYWTLLHTRGMQ